jgi:D-alanyl-lipoteichoic acid acyltransferase DltB (MBOAT superfamily)
MRIAPPPVPINPAADDRLVGDPHVAPPERLRLVHFADLVGLGVIALQLFLALLVARQYTLESAALRQVLMLAAAGFVVHVFLPPKLKLWFFLGLSLVASLLIFGHSGGNWSAREAAIQTATLFASGILLVAICHLYIGFWKRVFVLAGAGIFVGLMHAGYFGPPLLRIVWPVLAALFMFRIIVYHYVISTSTRRPTVHQSLSYFFPLPNLACSFFPVVDFKTFCSGYRDRRDLVLAERGVRWMVRGILQLLAYRFANRVFLLKPEDVANGADVVQYVLANLFLYVRVSGLMHLVVGSLLLFGFDLPETNHRYFLASSFTDYWRRVNIYWKDFILHVFYFPAYFRLKDRGATFAVVVATLFSFAVTWLLHAYQTWWLTGKTSFSWPDTLFWFALALLVLVNSLWELKRGRQRRLWGQYDLAGTLRLALRTAGTFACIAVLWSLWSSQSVGDWLRLWMHADGRTVFWGSVTLLFVAAAAIVVEVLLAPALDDSSERSLTPAFWLRGAAYICALPIIYAAGFEPVQLRCPPRAQPYLVALSQPESPLGGGADRGYYEAILNAANSRQPGYTMVRPVKDLRIRELVPSNSFELAGATVTTNRWGMRDQEYELAKSPKTMRMALLGSSNTMGFGVDKRLTWETLLEDRLNREARANDDKAGVEIMNFATMGYSPLSQVMVVEKQAARFKPDIVLFVAHLLDASWIPNDLIACEQQGIPIPFDYLRDVLDEANVDGRTNTVIAQSRLKPYEPVLLDWTYKRLAEECKAIGAVPVAILMQLPWEASDLRRMLVNQDERSRAQLSELERAGFIVVDMSATFNGMARSELILNKADRHCNPYANRIIAEQLYEKLLADPRIGLQEMHRRP